MKLCSIFQIPLDVTSSNENERDFMDRLVREIFEKMKLLSPEEQSRLYNEVVEGNQHYQQFLELFSRARFLTYRGRSEAFALQLKNEKGKQDAYFIVGAHHMKLLITDPSLHDWNVFGVRPNTIPRDEISVPKVQWSIDDWEQDLREYDKIHFGFRAAIGQ
ncbi:MAG: hypothetical protein Q8P95_05240 [bacterium]|nr:hypothetical protein [bacterium]